MNPARPSSSANKKKTARRTAKGLPIRGFKTLVEELGTLYRNACHIGSDPTAAAFFTMTDRTPLQAKAFQLLGL